MIKIWKYLRTLDSELKIKSSRWLTMSIKSSVVKQSLQQRSPRKTMCSVILILHGVYRTPGSEQQPAPHRSFKCWAGSSSWANVWWIINQTHYGKAVFTQPQPRYFAFLSQPVRAVHEERCARADAHKTTRSIWLKEKIACWFFLQQQE